jgi:hypothetical protein
MTSTLLYLIVKQWFEDKSGTELDDAVIDAIIKELTEKKDNRITITDIEPKSSPIHYESKKDAEANKESDWISVNDRMPEEIKFKAEDYLVFNDQGEIEVCFINNGVFRDQREDRNVIASHWRYLPEPPKNNEPKEEQETSRTAGEIMFIAEVREDNSDIKIYHVVNSRNKDEAFLKVEKYYEIKAELNGRRYVINIKDYEYIS